jgi:hypothetical protein
MIFVLDARSLCRHGGLVVDRSVEVEVMEKQMLTSGYTAPLNGPLFLLYSLCPKFTVAGNVCSPLISLLSGDQDSGTEGVGSNDEKFYLSIFLF